MTVHVTPEQEVICSKNGFYAPRIIDGKLCALHTYATTVGICIDISEICTELRYCYQDPLDAIEAFGFLTSLDKHPGGNWIKVKGKFKGRFIDDFNPNWVDADGNPFSHVK